jgi:anaerobic selenocysteine-containing dehydrogenase
MQGCIPTPDALEMIEKGKVKAGIMQGTNPLVMLANTNVVKKILSKLEFVVVVDPYISETAKQLADIVLPAASYLERAEPIYFQYDRWYPYIRLRRKVATFGEALPDWLISVKLGQALGFYEYFPNEDIEYYTNLFLEPSGITFEQLENSKWIQFGEIEYRKYEKNGFDLPSGKANIYSLVFEQMGYEPLPRYVEGSENRRSTPEIAKEYPFICFTGRPGAVYVHDQGRTLPWQREVVPVPRAMVNTLDAEEHNINDGDWIILESRRGNIRIQAEVTNKVGQGCIYVPGGWVDANFNVMGIDEDICPISSQPNYMSCLVKMSVERSEKDE